MPGKSQHGRRKLPRSKRRRGRQDISATSIQQRVVAQTYKPVSKSASPPEVSAPPARVPATTVTPAATRYPYIAAELRRIGILAGVMLVILVILALVFS